MHRRVAEFSEFNHEQDKIADNLAEVPHDLQQLMENIRSMFNPMLFYSIEDDQKQVLRRRVPDMHIDINGIG